MSGLWRNVPPEIGVSFNKLPEMADQFAFVPNTGLFTEIRRIH